jgi:DNA-binding Lrp family transcriptional regulator
MVTVVRAYVLIQTEVGLTAGVATEVRAIHGVSSSEAVTGPYDVIATVEAANIDDLGKMIVSRIQGVNGVARTLTCPVIRI